MTELSERLQLAQSTVTELVRRAEEAGLIEREQSEDDGRVAYLRLTEEGDRRLGEAFAELDDDRQRLLEAFLGCPAPLGTRGRSLRRLTLPWTRSIPRRAVLRDRPPTPPAGRRAVKIELLYWEGCPSHPEAEALLRDVLRTAASTTRSSCAR